MNNIKPIQETVIDGEHIDLPPFYNIPGNSVRVESIPDPSEESIKPTPEEPKKPVHEETIRKESKSSSLPPFSDTPIPPPLHTKSSSYVQQPKDSSLPPSQQIPEKSMSSIPQPTSSIPASIKFSKK